MNKKTKKTLLLIAKLTLAVGILAIVYRKFDWGRALDAIVQADKSLLVVALSGFFLSLVIIGVRLWSLMRVQEIPIGLWEMIRLTFLGQLFNAVVPGTVGGDLVKAFYAAKHTSNKGAALITVFIDRLMGLTELSLLAGIMLLIVLASGQRTLQELRDPGIACIAAIGAVFSLMIFLFSRRFRRMFGLEKAYSKLPIAHHFDSAADAAHKFRQHKGSLVAALFFSLAAHSAWIVGVMLIGRGLGIEASWHHYFVFIPLIYIIGAVPLTPGGVGLVESFYAAFFVPVIMAATGMIETDAITDIGTLAFIVRFFDIVRGLPGIAVLLTGTKVPKADVLAAELEGEMDDNSIGDQGEVL